MSCSRLSYIIVLLLLLLTILPGVVLVLVVCHTPKTFINLYESYQVTHLSCFRQYSMKTLTRLI